MRVLVVPMDDGACGQFRIRLPAAAAKAAGVDVEVAHDGSLPVVADVMHDGSYKVWEFRHDCDVLVVQRPLMQGVHAAVVAAKRQGIAVVVELDDDLHAVHKQNTMADAVSGKYPLHQREWVTRTVALADLLVVSTPALAKYAPDRAVVVRNRLPAAALPARPGVSPVRGVLGWTGALNVHPEDLQQTRSAVRVVGAPFRVVGSETGVSAALRAAPGQVTLGAGWDPDLLSYWRNVAANIGVGIAPLQISTFNRAKSWLKCVEYLYLGIPFVASPLPEYQQLVDESGAGVIARSQSDWVRGLRTFLRDDSAYEKARANGLEWATEHTLENHVHEWTSAWQMAMDRRKGRVAL